MRSLYCVNNQFPVAFQRKLKFNTAINIGRKIKIAFFRLSVKNSSHANESFLRSTEAVPQVCNVSLNFIRK